MPCEQGSASCHCPSGMVWSFRDGECVVLGACSYDVDCGVGKRCDSGKCVSCGLGNGSCYCSSGKAWNVTSGKCEFNVYTCPSGQECSCCYPGPPEEDSNGKVHIPYYCDNGESPVPTKTKCTKDCSYGEGYCTLYLVIICNRTCLINMTI